MLDYKNRTDLSIDFNVDHSINKTNPSNPISTRNYSLISPSSISEYKPKNGSDYSNNIKLIYSDGLQFKDVNSQTLFFVKIGLDIKVTPKMIKQIFKDEAEKMYL